MGQKLSFIYTNRNRLFHHIKQWVCANLLAPITITQQKYSIQTHLMMNTNIPLKLTVHKNIQGNEIIIKKSY